MTLCGVAHADFYFQQNVRVTQEGLDGAQESDGTRDFQRKIYVTGQVLAIQVEEKGQLKKEYGFDFSKNLYYEADPVTGYYKWFDLDVLDKAFKRMGQEVSSFQGSRQRVAQQFTRAMLEGRIDYPVNVTRSFFGKKSVAGLPAERYKLRTGPGTSFLNFFGWYRKADIWASSDVPGFSEYAPVRMKLRRRAAFYKIKHNRVSDFILMISELEPVPLVVDSTARRCFERATSVETAHETVSAAGTSRIKPSQLLYFKQSKLFSWNVIYSKGTEFGPEVSLQRGEPFNWRRLLPWLIAPVFFLVLTGAWFLGPFPEKDRFSLQRKLVLQTYLLSAFLFALQTVHYLSDAPYLFSPLWEFSGAAALGAAMIVWQVCSHLRDIDRQMREAGLRYCPHCHARCEAFYVVCPKCNRAIMATQANGSPIPPE